MHALFPEFRGFESKSRCCCGGSDTECEGESCDGCVSFDFAPDDDAGPGAQTDNVQCWTPEQTIHTSTHPRSQPSLLLHCHQLQVRACSALLSIDHECCRKNELEERMLLNLSKKRWTDGLSILDFEKHAVTNEKFVSELKDLSEKYIKVCPPVRDTVFAVECIAGRH